MLRCLLNRWWVIRHRCRDRYERDLAFVPSSAAAIAIIRSRQRSERLRSPCRVCGKRSCVNAR